MAGAFDRLATAWTGFGERTFIDFEGTTLSFAELARRADGYRSSLDARGIRPGDRVALLADTHPDVVVALFGHHRAGVVHVPINARYRVEEVRHILSDCGPKLLLVDAAHRALAQQAAPDVERMAVGDASSVLAETTGAAPPPSARSDEDPALMSYTSGTTGPSKGVVLSYRAVADSMSSLTGLWGWSPADRQVLALPLFHVHGLCIGIHGGALRGTGIRLLPAFDPARVVAGIAEGGTIFMGVPTMYHRLLAHLDAHEEAKDVLRQARLFTAGSAALSPDNFERFEAATGHRIVERYGMSETLITLANSPDRPRRPGRVGRPVPGYEARIVDDDGTPVAPGVIGDLEVRGVGLMTEYWGRPDATADSYRADGWFRTGDVARQDEHGDYRIEGRRSVDIIKSGGFKISAREIEDVLKRHPSVVDAAVVGVPDPEWGQAIVAVVVPVDAPSDDLGSSLIAWTGEHLASFKKPRRVRFVNDLPRNALGKVQKHILQNDG